MFCKKGVLRNFTNFAGKHLCQSLFLNIVAGLRPATLLKKRLWHRCFLMNLRNFKELLFFIEHPWWLLLNMFYSKIICCQANKNYSVKHKTLIVIICFSFNHQSYDTCLISDLQFIFQLISFCVCVCVKF